MSLAFEKKTFCVWKGDISKSHDSQIVPKCDFENGGTTIQIGILLVLLNILSIFYCLGYMTRLAISRCKKTSYSISRFEEN